MMNSFQKTFLVVALALLLPPLALSPVFGAVFQVSPDGDDDCSDLACGFQSALDAAATNQQGDELIIEAGIYQLEAPLEYIPTDENFPLSIKGSPGMESIIQTGLDFPMLIINTKGMDSDDQTHIWLASLYFFREAPTVTSKWDIFIQVQYPDIQIDNLTYDGIWSGFFLATDFGSIYIDSPLVDPDGNILDYTETNLNDSGQTAGASVCSGACGAIIGGDPCADGDCEPSTFDPNYFPFPPGGGELIAPSPTPNDSFANESSGGTDTGSSCFVDSLLRK